MNSFRSLLLITLFSLQCSLQAASVGYNKPWGKGKKLAQPIKPRKSKEKPLTVPERLAKTVILFHQQVLSPTDGPRSHYRPSSSEYMKQAIERHGFMMGYPKNPGGDFGLSLKGMEAFPDGQHDFH